MKVFRGILITIQLICFAYGIYLLGEGSVFWGLFIIATNAIGIPLNIAGMHDTEEY